MSLRPTDADLDAADRRGDPPADAVAGAAAADPAVWADLTRALRHGSTHAQTPAVRDFTRGLEALTAAADPARLAEGELVSHTSSQAVHVLDVGAGALISSYRAPRTSHILMGTGRLTRDATHRLTDTARWMAAASVPGGLERGAEGYVLTGHVRVGHAAARLAVQRQVAQGHPVPDLPDGAVPISQVDSLRTWLDFTLVAPRSAEALGHGVTAAEYRRFLEHWRYLGALLGVEPGLLAHVVDRASAEDLHDRIDARTAPPTQDCRDLTAAGLGALAGELAKLGPIPLWYTTFIMSLSSRAMLGDDLADALGVRRYGPATAALRPLAFANRTWRSLLRRSPALWRAGVERNVRATLVFLAQARETAAGQAPAASAGTRRPAVSTAT